MVNERNPDNESRGASSNRGLVFGSVDSVHGPGALEVPGFIPTRHELIQLAKFWAEEELYIMFFHFVTGISDGKKSRLRPFANGRVVRIASLLGDDLIGVAVDEVYEQFQEECNERLWDIFVNGDKAQWDYVQSQFHEKTDSGAQELFRPRPRSNTSAPRIPTVERVDHLHGLIGWEAELVIDFVPTRHELVLVANCWAKRKVEVGTGLFHNGETHETELCLFRFADARITHIANLLGDDDLDTAIEEVFGQSRESQEKDLWQIYVDHYLARASAARQIGLYL